MLPLRRGDSRRHRREQSIGDPNEDRKYTLLRAFAADGANRIAVAWMPTPPDDRNDGDKRGDLDLPEKRRRFDPEAFDVLRGVEDGPGVARLRAIAASGIIPGATDVDAELPRVGDFARPPAIVTRCPPE